MKAKTKVQQFYKPQIRDGGSSFWYENWLGSGRLCERVDYVHISDTNLTIADVCASGSWDLNSLYTVLPLEICQEISAVRIPSLQTGHDSLCWTGTNNGRYNTSSSYSLLVDTGNIDYGPWKKIWRLKIPEKVKFFLWLVLHDALPTNNKRWRNHLSTTARCPVCDDEVEDINHLFQQCLYIRDLWSCFAPSLPRLQTVDNVQAWLMRSLALRNHLLFIAILWRTWLWRNNKVFGEECWNINQATQLVLMDVSNWRTFLNLHKEGNIASVLMTGTHDNIDVELRVDGSWDPNTRRMGIAVVLLTSNGTWMSAFAECISGGSAFLAEMKAIELGLKKAWDLGYRNIRCASDCMQAIQVLQSPVDVDTYWDKEIIIDVRQLLQWEWSVTLIHISRDQNNTADHLARLISREDVPCRTWRQPPTFLAESIYLDSFSVSFALISLCNQKNMHITVFGM